MIKNPQELQKFEKEFQRKEKLNILRKLKILNALYKEAIALGVMPLKDPLEGLNVDIKIARVVNSVPRPP